MGTESSPPPPPAKRVVTDHLSVTCATAEKDARTSLPPQPSTSQGVRQDPAPRIIYSDSDTDDE
jgi:hypothetical protein